MMKVGGVWKKRGLKNSWGFPHGFKTVLCVLTVGVNEALVDGCLAQRINGLDIHQGLKVRLRQQALRFKLARSSTPLFFVWV